MLIACQAWEGMYQGLHGIESLAILELPELEPEVVKKYINNWGQEESEQLIYSYGLEDEYLSEFDEDDEDADIAESMYFYDRGWRAMIVKPGLFDSAAAADKKLCALGYEVFISEYCEGEIEL